MRRGLGLVLLALAVAGLSAVPRSASASTSREDQMRAEIAQFLNAERTHRGLSELYFDRDLQQAAQTWAERNRTEGCEPPADCHSPGTESEILAWGGPESKTGKIVVAWMQSPNHRNLALHPKATSLGVGFACSSAGHVFAVVQFRGIRKPVMPTEENPIATASEHGSACVGAAGPPPRELAAAPPPTAPPTTAPPATAPPIAAPTVERRTPPPTVAATTSLPPVITPTTEVASTAIVLSAVTPELTADDVAPVPDPVAELALAEVRTDPPPAEPAWIAVLVVVLLLSAMRVAGAVRDRSKESARRLGL